MKTLKILTISTLIIATFAVMGVKANAETQQELDNRTLYKGTDIQKAIQVKYKKMNLDYFTENELNQAIQSDVNYFETSPNAEMENSNADNSQIITTYEEDGKYIVVLGSKPTFVEPMEVKEAELTEEIEPATTESIEVIENDTNTNFQPRVVFDAEAEAKAKQEQEQYKSLFPFSGFWHLLKNYPFQTAGSMIVMLMCLISIGTMEANRNNGSGKGDKDNEN